MRARVSILSRLAHFLFNFSSHTGPEPRRTRLPFINFSNSPSDIFSEDLKRIEDQTTTRIIYYRTWILYHIVPSRDMVEVS